MKPPLFGGIYLYFPSEKPYMELFNRWVAVWRVWKLLLIGAGVIVAIGALTAYFGSLLFAVLVVGGVGTTIFLYRKASARTQ